MHCPRTQAALVLAFIVGAVCVGCGSDETTGCDRYRFSPQEWRQSSPPRTADELTTRRAAADALVECSLLLGRTKREVVRLLGNPEQRYATVWTYTVGDERGSVAVDSEVLEVVFRDERVVSSVELGET